MNSTPPDPIRRLGLIALGIAWLVVACSGPAASTHAANGPRGSSSEGAADGSNTVNAAPSGAAASQTRPLPLSDDGDCTTWLADGRFLISGYAVPTSGSETAAERPIADLADAGYTHIGPYYDLDPAAYIAEAAAADLCIVYQLGDPDLVRADVLADQDRWLAEVRQHLERVLVDEETSALISMWMLLPEELDVHKSGEGELLARLGQLVDEVDPLRRPVGMFATSNADELEFSAIVADLDAVTQGQYLVNDGQPHERATLPFRVTRASQFAADAGGRFVLPVLEHGISDEDVDRADEPFIEAWVRHDIRAALAAGADGFFSFSHSERGRPEVFERYSSAFIDEIAALDAAGLLDSNPVRTPLAAEVGSGPPSQAVVEILSAGNRPRDWPSVTATELVGVETSWILVVNHTDEPLTVSVTGHVNSYVETGTGRSVPADSFEIDLDPYEAVLGEKSP